MIRDAETVRALEQKITADVKKDALIARLMVALENGQIDQTELLDLIQDPKIERDDDLRSLCEELKKELELTKEELSEYRCPFCQSPIAERGGFWADSENYVAAETFECGYATTDYHLERPCPSDPRFPKFEDFDLEFIEETGSPREQWYCRVHPKTPMARSLHLVGNFGPTQEEAVRRIREEYDRHANRGRRCPIGQDQKTGEDAYTRRLSSAVS